MDGMNQSRRYGAILFGSFLFLFFSSSLLAEAPPVRSVRAGSGYAFVSGQLYNYFVPSWAFSVEGVLQRDPLSPWVFPVGISYARLGSDEGMGAYALDLISHYGGVGYDIPFLSWYTSRVSFGGVMSRWVLVTKDSSLQWAPKNGISFGSYGEWAHMFHFDTHCEVEGYIRLTAPEMGMNSGLTELGIRVGYAFSGARP
jgi:hypothetical protein